MKNFLLIFLLIFLNTSLAFWDSWSSSVSWNSNSWQTECWTSTSHSVLHYWVPSSNGNNVWLNSSSTCITRNYYSSADYTISFTYSWWVTNCWPWEKVVSWDSWARTIVCRKYDITPPSPWDITSALANQWYFRANSNFWLSVIWNSAWWAPITLLQWQFENVTNQALFNSVKSSNSDINSWTLNTLETVEDASMVDNFIENSNNYRSYTYNITNICDEALNCTINPTSFTYNVFAWYINNSNSNSSWASNLVWQEISGNSKQLTINLKDDYNNKIIPVFQADWITPVRTIDFTVNYDNSLYLNQYNKTWDSWVDIAWADDNSFLPTSIWLNQSNINTISNKLNNDWVYNLNFKVFSPTYNSLSTNWQQYVDWNFNIDNIVAKTSDNSSSNTVFWYLDFDFRAPYKTEITWSMVNNNFIVWTTQSWTINVTNWWTKNVYLEFWYFDPLSAITHRVHPKFDLDFKKLTTDSWTRSAEWNTNPYTNLSSFWDFTSNIFTKINQNWPLSAAEQNTYFATHISTNIWWKDIFYSSDVFWMNRYAWLDDWNNTSQRWIKINWLTHSKNQVNIVDWQSSTDINLLWSLEKSYFQRDIRKNAYSLIKWIVPPNLPNKTITDIDQLTPWYRLWDVLYFGWLNWEDVTINISNYDWVKTILVVWGNVYIRSNVISNNKSSDILWIISLKNDTTWNWWNIYIHPDVLEVDAVMYADKSLVTYDWINEISPDNGWTYEYLNKQLYIYWSVFSNNTIWWSVDPSNFKCPFYIPNSSCTLDTAQKYDMNYLRRWYEVKQLPSYEDYPVIINYNSLIQLTPPPLFEKQ